MGIWVRLLAGTVTLGALLCALIILTKAIDEPAVLVGAISPITAAIGGVMAKLILDSRE